MMPVLEAMNQTVTVEIFGGEGDAAVRISGICRVIMPEGCAARGGNCRAVSQSRRRSRG
jgi:hypothetical protein